MQVDLSQTLKDLPDWEWEADRTAIARRFTFPDFLQAFAFMQAIALKADAMDHHPEWSNVYNQVHIRWTSHDANALTERDRMMAVFCDALFASTQGDQHARTCSTG